MLKLKNLIFVLIFYLILSQWSYSEEIKNESFTNQPFKVFASSTLSDDKKINYGVQNLFDNNPETAWIEGKPGFGEGENVVFQFKKGTKLIGIKAIPGYAKNAHVLQKNAFPEFKVEVDGTLFETGSWASETQFKAVETGQYLGEPYKVPANTPEHFHYRYWFFPNALEIKELKFTITGVLSKIGVDADSGFSEIVPITDDKDTWDSATSNLLLLRESIKERLPTLLLPTLATCNIPNYKENSLIFKSLNSQKVQDLTFHYLGGSLGNSKFLKDSVTGDNVSVRGVVFMLNSQVGSQFMFPISLSSACWSDGEGGRLYYPSIQINDGQIKTIKIIEREDRRF